MSYYIYGLRLIGELECRYVGMTGNAPQRRLSELKSAARERAKHHPHWMHPDGLYSWLLANESNVEAFKIGKTETGIEARVMEKAIIALVLQLGHRLLNVMHVPDGQRIGYVGTAWVQEMRARRLAKAA